MPVTDALSHDLTIAKQFNLSAGPSFGHSHLLMSDSNLLDTFPNPAPGRGYVIEHTHHEFTSLCPITGQPDFAHFVFDYCPGAKLLESKSLKLYLMSFRNMSAFHEDCTLAIGKRIASAIKPKYLRIAGFWYPRGGIPIDVFWQTGRVPKDIWLPEPGVSPYRGRG